MDSMELDELQIKMLKTLKEHEDESILFYRYFSDAFDVERKDVRRAMFPLLYYGLVEHKKGVISDAGPGYYGSGFVITMKGVLELNNHG